MKRALFRIVAVLCAAQWLAGAGVAGDDPVDGVANAATAAPDGRGGAASSAASAPTPVQAQKVLHPEQAPLLAAAVVGKRLVAAGDYGTILLSDDGGRSWRQAQSVPTRVTLTALEFVDDRHGWAVGHGGIVLSTDDGGEHWNLRHRAGSDVALFSVHFDDLRRGLVVGSFGFALRTDDGGANWRRISVGDEDAHLYQIFTDPRGATWIAAEMGAVYRSDDGENFERVEIPYSGSLWGGTASADGSILLWGMGGTLLRSPDGGQSWRETPTNTQNPITAACPLPDGRLILVGLGGTVLSSSDGGATVSTEVRPTRHAYTAAIVAHGEPLLFSLAGVEPPQPRESAINR